MAKKRERKQREPAPERDDFHVYPTLELADKIRARAKVEGRSAANFICRAVEVYLGLPDDGR